MCVYCHIIGMSEHLQPYSKPLFPFSFFYELSPKSKGLKVTQLYFLLLCMFAKLDNDDFCFRPVQIELDTNVLTEFGADFTLLVEFTSKIEERFGKLLFGS